MNWYDVEDILFDGKEEEMNNLSCPDCKGAIRVKYDEDVRAMEITCTKCGHMERSHGGEIPKFYSIFGKEKMFGNSLQR